MTPLRSQPDTPVGTDLAMGLDTLSFLRRRRKCGICDPGRPHLITSINCSRSSLVACKSGAFPGERGSPRPSPSIPMAELTVRLLVIQTIAKGAVLRADHVCCSERDGSQIGRVSGAYSTALAPQTAGSPSETGHCNPTSVANFRIRRRGPYARNAAISRHFVRDPIPYALEADWPVGAAGFEPLHLEIRSAELHPA
jgi:hypothetical protein